MIPVARVPEPPEFAPVSARGNAWLAANPNAKERPPSTWRDFSLNLAAGFNYRCGYMALWTTDGTVDHHVSIDEDRSLAYDWNNYRYVAGWVNSSKQNVPSTDIIDPYEVEDGWFEVLLPTCELVHTDKVPPQYLARVQNTLARLPIGRDERALRRRGIYFDMFVSKALSLDEVKRQAPLVGAAIEKWLAQPVA